MSELSAEQWAELSRVIARIERRLRGIEEPEE